MPKLHGFGGRYIGCVFIDTRDGVIADPSGSLISLWDHSRGADVEVFQVINGLVGQDYPLILSNHVDKLFFQKIDKFEA